ncbi:TolC family protein, partial [Planctomycetota bacterium]
MRVFSISLYIIIALILGGCADVKDSTWTPPAGVEEFDRSVKEHGLGIQKAQPDSAEESNWEKELAGELTAEVLVRAATERNPKIKALRNHYRAARYRILPARSMDDPMLKMGVFGGDPIETRAGAQEGKIGLSQKVPWPGKLELKGELAGQKAEIIQERMQAAEDQVIARVRSAFYQYYFVAKSIKITNEDLEILRRFEKVAQTKYAAAKATQQDVLKAQVEISTLENILLTLAQEKATAIAGINSSIDRHPEAKLGEPKEVLLSVFDANLNGFYTKAAHYRPELKIALYQIEKSQTSVELARKDYFPDFNFGIDYTFIEAGSNPMFRRDGDDAIMFSVGLNLPLNRAKRKHSLLAAKSEKEAAKEQYRA